MQEHPERTFPSWVGKSVPGKTEPLTRLYTPDGQLKESNRTKSIAMCKNVWGDYDGSVQQCDEYPFASTYQGAATGAPNPSDLQRYSVRVIDANDNVHVGRDLVENNFYKTNRVLDQDQDQFRSASTTDRSARPGSARAPGRVGRPGRGPAALPSITRPGPPAARVRSPAA